MVDKSYKIIVSRSITNFLKRKSKINIMKGFVNKKNYPAIFTADTVNDPTGRRVRGCTPALYRGSGYRCGALPQTVFFLN